MYSSNSNTEPSSRFPNLKEVNPDIGLGEPLGFGKPAFGSAASGRSRPRLVKSRKPKGRMETGKDDSGFNPFRPVSDDSVPGVGSFLGKKLNFGNVGSENFVFVGNSDPNVDNSSGFVGNNVLDDMGKLKIGSSLNTNVENSSGFVGNRILDGMGKLRFGSDQEFKSTANPMPNVNANDRENFSHVEGSDKVIPVSGGVFKGIGIDKNVVSKLPEEIGKLNIEGSANLERSKNLKDVSFNVSAENKTHFSFGSSDNAAKSCVTSVASELPNELKKLNIGKGSRSLGGSSAASILPEKMMNLNVKDPVNTDGGEKKDDNFSANDQSGFMFRSDRGSSGIFYGKADSMLSDDMLKLKIATQGGDNNHQRQTCFGKDSMGNLSNKNRDDYFKPVRDFVEVPFVVRPGKKDEFNFTSSWNGVGPTHVEFTTPNPKGNIFPGFDEKLEFSAKLESTKDARSKKRRGKLKKPTSSQPLLGKDFVFTKSSSQENPDSFEAYSPMDVSPYQEILADITGSRDTSVTSEEASHPFINDASSESRPTVLNDATDEDLVFATQRMDINYDDGKSTEREVGNSEYWVGKEGGAKSPSPESAVRADSESFKTANEQLECSTDSFVTAMDNEVSSRLRIERQDSDGRMQFSFTTASEDVGGTSFMFAASSSVQGQSSATMRHQKKKNRAKVVQESYSSSTPNTIVPPASSSMQFFPNSDTTSLLSPRRGQRGDLPSSLSRRGDKMEAVKEQEVKQSSTPAASIAAQEACDKWRLRGNQAYANGDMSRAEDYYTQGVSCISENENSKSCLRALMLCYSNRAATRMSLGRMREALADCMQAAAIDPNFLRVQVRAANCYLALGEVEDASPHFMKCLQSGSEACMDRKLVLEASEGLDKAQKVSECMKQSAELLRQRTSSDAESALGVIAQALTISSYCEKLLEMKADALLMLRKYEELIQLCEQTLVFAEMNYHAIIADSHSLNASFRVWRLRLSIKSYFYLGRLEEALDFLKKQEESVSTKKESESKSLASLLPLAGTIVELVRRKTAGNEAFQSGRHTEAIEHYTAALSCTVESRPFAAVCFCNRAAAYKAMGQIVDAIADCSLAIALDGNYLKAISRRATLFEMIRDYDQATADLQRLVSVLVKQVEDKANQSGASDRSSSVNELRQAQLRLSAMEEEARKEIPLNMYLILGIDPSVMVSEIKKAYRKAALRHHPDKAGQSLAKSENGDDELWKEVVEEVHKGADRLFKMIGQAYAVLSDPNKRSRYDLEEEMRNAQKRGNGGSASRMHTDVHNYPFERSGSRRQWQEVWRSYGNSQSRASETNRSSSMELLLIVQPLYMAFVWKFKKWTRKHGSRDGFYLVVVFNGWRVDGLVLIFGSFTEDEIKSLQGQSPKTDIEIRFGSIDSETLKSVGIFSTKLSEVNHTAGCIPKLVNKKNAATCSTVESTALIAATTIDENGSVHHRCSVNCSDGIQGLIIPNVELTHSCFSENVSNFSNEFSGEHHFGEIVTIPSNLIANEPLVSSSEGVDLVNSRENILETSNGRTAAVRNLLPRGLVNLGNLCFLNATLQALLSCPPFVLLLQELRTRDIPMDGYPTLRAFVEFISDFDTPMESSSKKKEMDLETGKPFRPDMFETILKMFTPDVPNSIHGRPRQEDAQEFLSFIMHQMHDELLKLEGQISICNGERTSLVSSINDDDDDDYWETVGPKNKTAITRTQSFIPSKLSVIFGGQLRSVVKARGSKASATVQPFLLLHLNICPEPVCTIEDALHLFSAPETLEGYRTSAPGKAEVVNASKSVKILELSEIMILHLMRFSYGSQGSTKLHKPVRFPLELVFGREIMVSPSSEGRRYELVASITHHGRDPSKGHYTADTRHPNGKWLHFDDASVTVIPTSKFYEELVTRKASGIKCGQLANKPLNRNTKSTYSDSSSSDEDDDDDSNDIETNDQKDKEKDNDEPESHADGDANLENCLNIDSIPHKLEDKDNNKEDATCDESRAVEGDVPPAKKQCIEANAFEGWNVITNKMEKSVDRLIEVELEELGDKNKVSE
ncbi:hypothetical protein RHMOL_Rhmol13G0285100 [Rhododendron molle]|uniref:Uncharacterized protein n=1 Tax=Rhododendron molle TaxID=49168 RepID=A0ACC0LDA8_RHOML|nr:hypothetical protein RHMOL_Rhmol13G0285100 [Rhododendron molle]